MRMTLARSAIALSAALCVVTAGAAHAQSYHVARYSIGGDGGTDYVTAEPGTGRVFVSRGTHVMVIDGATGKVIGDIPDTPRTHGIALVPKTNHGFTTNGGDSTVTMFDLKTLAVIKKIKVPAGGLDGIMYDDADTRDPHESQSSDRHGRPRSIRQTETSSAQAELEDDAPEGAASDGQRADLRQQRREEHDPGARREDDEGDRVMAARAVRWADRHRLRRVEQSLFSGCGKTSVVLDAPAARSSRRSRTATASTRSDGTRRKS